MQGHVRKRGNKWCAVVYMGLDANGKRKYKWFSGYTTKKEAQKALVEKLQEVNTGSYIEPTKMTLSEFSSIWFESHKSQVRPITYEGYERNLRLHIIPELGHMALSNIRGHHIQSLYSKLQSELSPKSIQGVHHVMRLLIRDALKWEYISKDIMKQVTPPRVPRPTRPVWGFEEVQAFKEVVKTHELGAAFMLAITTGMRRSELLGLQWDDIDFENKRIHVQRSLKYENNELVLSDVKTSSSRRTISLSVEDIEILREHRKNQLEQRMQVGPGFNPNNLVFVKKDGGMIRPTALSHQWKCFLEHHNLKHIPLHGSRHTHATLLLSLGVHPKVIQERLGHSGISITMDLYSHVLPGMQEEAVEKLMGKIAGKNK